VGELRPEMIKTTAIAPKIATEIISGLGLVPVRICTLAGHAGFMRVEIGSNDRAKGLQLWMQTRRQAEKVITEIFSADPRVRRAGTGLVIEADAGEAERLVLHFAALNDYRVIRDDAVTDLKSRFVESISASVAQMQVDGRLKALNRHYKALPAPRMSYSSYLLRELRGIAGRLHPADVRSLRSRLQRL
jgi:hypothetical protein